MCLVTRGGWLAVMVVAAALLSPIAPAISDPGTPVPRSSSGATPSGDQDALFPTTLEGPDAAAKLTPSELKLVADRAQTDVATIKQVLDDPTSRVAPQGLLFHVEHAPSIFAAQARTVSATGAPSLAQTFARHSKPGTGRVIFLDFAGSSGNEHGWDLAPADRPPFSIDDNPTFSLAERALIHEVWARVAEDFAPFDVDVTTEDPGAEGLVRSSANDSTYGVRLLITQDERARGAICGNFKCSGVAYLGVFTSDGWESTEEPLLDGWIFADMNWFDPLLLAETISHEAGHTFGLHHDGTSSNEYFSGHGNWVPIMGSTANRQISQWSAGEYTGANNKEDDLAIIARSAPLVADDHGNVASTATNLGRQPEVRSSGVISTRTDKDVIRIDLSACAGTMSVKVTPAEHGPNLDIRVQVRNALGQPQGPAQNPISSRSGALSGMGVDFDLKVAAGVYFIEIDGVGAHNPRTTGYSDYGSLGEWNLEVSGCGNDKGAGTPPGLPLTSPNPARRFRTGTTTSSSVTVRWNRPTASEPQPDKYRLVRNGKTVATITGRQTQYTFVGLKPATTYRLAIVAEQSGLRSRAVSVRRATLTAPAPAPRTGTATSGKKGGTITATARWSAPTSRSGVSIKSYRVTAYRLDSRSRVLSRKTYTAKASARALTMKMSTKGRYRFTVVAVNRKGVSKRSTYSRIVTAQ